MKQSNVQLLANLFKLYQNDIQPNWCDQLEINTTIFRSNLNSKSLKKKPKLNDISIDREKKLTKKCEKNICNEWKWRWIPSDRWWQRKISCNWDRSGNRIRLVIVVIHLALCRGLIVDLQQFHGFRLNRFLSKPNIDNQHFADIGFEIGIFRIADDSSNRFADNLQMKHLVVAIQSLTWCHFSVINFFDFDQFLLAFFSVCLWPNHSTFF